MHFFKINVEELVARVWQTLVEVVGHSSLTFFGDALVGHLV